MHRNLFILLFLIFILYSCNYKKYKNRITAGKGTYWDVIKLHNKEFKEPLYSYYFGINGDCKYYSLRKSPDGDLKRYIVEPGAISSNTWKMMSDTLQIRDTGYLLISGRNKKLLLTNLKNAADTLELIESAIQ